MKLHLNQVQDENTALMPTYQWQWSTIQFEAYEVMHANYYLHKTLYVGLLLAVEYFPISVLLLRLQ